MLVIYFQQKLLIFTILISIKWMPSHSGVNVGPPLKFFPFFSGLHSLILFWLSSLLFFTHGLPRGLLVLVVAKRSFSLKWTWESWLSLPSIFSFFLLFGEKIHSHTSSCSPGKFHHSRMLPIHSLCILIGGACLDDVSILSFNNRFSHTNKLPDALHSSDERKSRFVIFLEKWNWFKFIFSLLRFQMALITFDCHWRSEKFE